MNMNLMFKKLYFSGNSLGEEMLFGNLPERQLLESAKIISKSFFLEITVNDYLILKKSMKKYGNQKKI